MGNIMINTSDYFEKLNTFSENNAVYASENIYNNNGLLLMKKGLKLKSNIIQKIKESKLSKPLDHLITFEEVLTKDDIFQSINEIIEKYPFIGEIFISNKKNSLLLAQCLENYDMFPIIQQKLTMLKDINPYYYEKSVFCALFSIMIYQKNPTHFKHNINSVFFAAISNNLGALHISSDELKKNEDAINIISYTFLKDVSNFPKASPIFILQSLENYYGTGKPKKLPPEKIYLESQIIHIANDYHDYLIENQHNHFYQRIMVSYRYYSEIVSNSFIHLFKDKNHYSDKDFSEITTELVKEIPAIQQLFNQLRENYQDILKSTDATQKEQFLRIFENLIIFERSSGIIHDAFYRWVNYVHDNKLLNANEEMQSTYYMLKNFKEQIHLLMSFSSDFTMKKSENVAV